MQSMIAALGALSASFLLVILFGYAKRDRQVRTTTLLGLSIALACLLFLPWGFTNNLFRFDLFSVFFSALFLLVAFVVVLAVKDEGVTYYGSILLATIGMMTAGSANDLLLLFISVELLTAPGYVLTALGRTPGRIEAAVKYFVVSIVASALMLLGIVLLAIDSGTTFIPALQHNSGIFLLGITAVLAGLGFKMRVFPFNFWTPDVYQGAPPIVPGFLAGAGKKAGFAAFLLVAVVVAPVVRSWTLLIALLAALTMTVPNLSALFQQNARRLLAYSIMTHAGFLLMGLAVMSWLSVSGTLLHALTHAFMATGAFLVLAVFDEHGLRSINQLNGLGWRNPFLAASLTIFLLSLAGIPLLAGFASKFYLFYVVAVEGLLWLSLLAVANSIISFYYYFRIIRAMYGHKPAGKAYRVRYGMLAAIMICLFFTVFFGIYPMPIIDFAREAAMALF